MVAAKLFSISSHLSSPKGVVPFIWISQPYDRWSPSNIDQVKSDNYDMRRTPAADRANQHVLGSTYSLHARQLKSVSARACAIPIASNNLKSKHNFAFHNLESKTMRVFNWTHVLLSRLLVHPINFFFARFQMRYDQKYVLFYHFNFPWVNLILILIC